MFHSVMQSLFITTIGIMILGLVVPAFYHSDRKTNQLLTHFVIPIDNATVARQEFTVSHMETLLKQPHVLAENIVLVAYGKGVHLLERGNKLQARLETLIGKGVQCYACELTLAKQPERLALLDGVKNVGNGNQYIDTLMENGFTNSFA